MLCLLFPLNPFIRAHYELLNDKHTHTQTHTHTHARSHLIFTKYMGLDKMWYQPIYLGSFDFELGVD